MNSIFNYIDQMNDLLFLSLIAIFGFGTVIMYSTIFKKWGKGSINRSERG